MKRGKALRRILLAAALAAAWAGCLAADTRGSEDAVLKARPGPDMQVDQKCVYQVRWKGIPAGRASLAISRIEDWRGHKVYYARAEARSNSILDAFYKVRDKATSHIDCEGGFSHRYYKRLREGRYDKREVVEYHYDDVEARYSRMRLGDGEEAEENVECSAPLAGYAQDPLSWLFAIRKENLEVGRRLVKAIHDGHREWDLDLVVLAREKVRVGGLGTFWAFKVEPRAGFESVFVRKGPVYLWLEEGSKIPLRMEGELPIGRVVVELVDAVNCRIGPFGEGEP